MWLQRLKNLLYPSKMLSPKLGCYSAVSHVFLHVCGLECLFLAVEYGVKTFPSDNSKLAEMEFYLVDDLECDLTVFHPYRTLMAICTKEGSSENGDSEAGEFGAGIQDIPRYWGTGEGKLELQEGALQMAW